MKKEDEYDYGFTFVDEHEAIYSNPVHKALADEVKELQARLLEVKKTFLPLLENLSKDPDKVMIKWPDRAKIIEQQRQKLLKLTTLI